MSDLHRVDIEANDRSYMTRVMVDGTELRGITRVSFDTGEKITGTTTLRIEMYAEVHLTGKLKPDIIGLRPVALVEE